MNGKTYSLGFILIMLLFVYDSGRILMKEKTISSVKLQIKYLWNGSNPWTADVS